MTCFRCSGTVVPGEDGPVCLLCSRPQPDGRSLPLYINKIARPARVAMAETSRCQCGMSIAARNKSGLCWECAQRQHAQAQKDMRASMQKDER